MHIKAVCFDLYGALAVVENAMSEAQASDFLVSRGYEVYPQALEAAWHYVSFVDYPQTRLQILQSRAQTSAE